MTGPRLSPAVALLLVAVAVPFALLGVPGLLGSPRPSGALEGLVVDQGGYGVAQTPVYLFGEDLRLVERTLTDSGGRFAFQQRPALHHVLVRPPPERALAARWKLDQSPGGRLEFVLAPTSELELLVRDAAGDPVRGAEVRVYERAFEAAALDLTRTDAHGRVRLALPPRADLGVRLPGPAEHWLWRFDIAREAGLGTGRLELRARPSRLLTGTLRGAGDPAPGLWVLAGAVADSEWFGFARSAADGSFALTVPAAAPVELQVLDPQHRFLPQRVVPTGPAHLELELEHGEPLEVVLESGRRDPVARLWAWEPGSQVWSWGELADSRGQAAIRVGRRFGVHVQPRTPGYEGLTLWDLEYRSPFLHLSPSAGRP